MKNNEKENLVFEDISSNAPEDIKGRFANFMKVRFKPFFLRNKKRNLKATIAILGVFVVLAGTVAIIRFHVPGLIKNFLFGIDYNDEFTGNADATFSEDFDEDISYQAMFDISDANGINDLIKQWALNGGEKMKSKNVINVLLIGQDDMRSDSMILASVNRKTKKIILTSFLRDSYTYMNIDGSERFDKTNHSYAWGGASALIETLENNYKIKIDHYVTVNFDSFVTAIDAVGGVSVPISQAEADYMNKTTHFDDFKSGKDVTLDGDHALIFSRIRKLDSEADRTDRQKKVVTALIHKAKGASMSQLSNLVNKMMPNLTTNYSKTEILSLGRQALSEKWMDFDITMQTEPEEELRQEVRMRTYSYPKLFVWIVDYPIAAQNLQKSIFGTSNINIDPATHKSALDILNNSGTDPDEQDYNNDYSYDYNNQYDNNYNNGGYDYDYYYYYTSKRQYYNDETTEKQTRQRWTIDWNKLRTSVPRTEEQTEPQGGYEEPTEDYTEPVTEPYDPPTDPPANYEENEYQNEY